MLQVCCSDRIPMFYQHMSSGSYRQDDKRHREAETAVYSIENLKHKSKRRTLILLNS